MIREIGVDGNLISAQDREILQREYPNLLFKIDSINRSGVKINCHGAAIYLSGFNFGDAPKAISPHEMILLMGYRRCLLKPKKGSLAIARLGDLIAHSGIVLDEEDDPLILHKGGYNETFKIEPASVAFANSKIEYYDNK